GELEYEFYYDPGRATVAPALGRTAFLLTPDGVAPRRVGEGKFGGRGDAAAEPPASPTRRWPSDAPLRARAWNHVLLAVAGNRLTLAVNGAEVYRAELEDGPRVFGLFHFAGETEARARHVRLRGQWPRQLAAGGPLRPATPPP